MEEMYVMKAAKLTSGPHGGGGGADRGQGLQHCITDVRNYVDSLVQVRGGGADAAKAMQDFDDEVVARGAKAVQQSLQEAEKSFDLETIRKMLMVTQGHGRSA